MATTMTGKTQCIVCGKDRASAKCSGCLKDFCYKHLGEHRQELAKQRDEIELERDLFLQSILQQNEDPQKHELVREINQWEIESIEKIQKIAQEARDVILKNVDNDKTNVKRKLDLLTNQLKISREEEDDITEFELEQWKEQLNKLTEQLKKPMDITIRHTSTPIITDVVINILNSKTPIMPNISTNTQWTQFGQTLAGGNGMGDELNQFGKETWSLCIHKDRTIYLADSANHRIIAWKDGATTGQIVVGVNGKGNGKNQLNCPMHVIIDYETDSLIICDRGNRRVVRWPRQNGTVGETIISNICCRGAVIDSHGYLYVSDVEKHEVKRWKIGEQNGIIVAGGNSVGDRLDQFNEPRYLYVDQDHSIYVSDWRNHRIMKWLKGAKQGIVVAGGRNQGKNLTQLSCPQGIVVDQSGTIYIADFGGQRIVRWSKDANEGNVVIGGNDKGNEANQFHYPTDLAFDEQNSIYVLDRNNFRVQKFVVK